MPNTTETIKDLTLMLLYLTSWQEKAIDLEKEKTTTIPRSWKNYDFATLDALKDEKFILGTYKEKSVYFTDGESQRQKNCSQNTVFHALAREILAGKFAEGATVRVRKEGDGLGFE
jgi:hypothetical protein